MLIHLIFLSSHSTAEKMVSPVDIHIHKHKLSLSLSRILFTHTLPTQYTNKLTNSTSFTYSNSLYYSYTTFLPLYLSLSLPRSFTYLLEEPTDSHTHPYTSKQTSSQSVLSHSFSFYLPNVYNNSLFLFERHTPSLFPGHTQGLTLVVIFKQTEGTDYKDCEITIQLLIEREPRQIIWEKKHFSF